MHHSAPGRFQFELPWDLGPQSGFVTAPVGDVTVTVKLPEPVIRQTIFSSALVRKGGPLKTRFRRSAMQARNHSGPTRDPGRSPVAKVRSVVALLVTSVGRAGLA